MLILGRTAFSQKPEGSRKRIFNESSQKGDKRQENHYSEIDQHLEQKSSNFGPKILSIKTFNLL